MSLRKKTVKMHSVVYVESRIVDVTNSLVERNERSNRTRCTKCNVRSTKTDAVSSPRGVHTDRKNMLQIRILQLRPIGGASRKLSTNSRDTSQR